MRQVLLAAFIALSPLLYAGDAAALHRAAAEVLEAMGADVTVRDASVELVGSYGDMERADVKVVLSAPDGSSIEVYGFGIGPTQQQAVHDAAGYIRRVLPYEVHSVLSGNRIVHIDGQSVYLHIPTSAPVRTYRTDSALLRVTGPLEGPYVPARLVFAHGETAVGMTVHEVHRLGVSFRARAGYHLDDQSAVISVETIYDGHGRFWYPLVRCDWQEPDQLSIQAGWGMTIAPQRRADRYTFLQRSALKAYTAAGWDFSSAQAVGTAGIELAWYLSTRLAFGLYGEYRTIGGGITFGTAMTLAL